MLCRKYLTMLIMGHGGTKIGFVFGSELHLHYGFALYNNRSVLPRHYYMSSTGLNFLQALVNLILEQLFEVDITGIIPVNKGSNRTREKLNDELLNLILNYCQN